jgi:hypothetical protein
VINFQNSLISIYSKKLFGKSIKFEDLMNMREPIKNVCYYELFEFMLKDETIKAYDLLDEIKNIPKYNEVINAIKLISDIDRNIIN